MSAAERFTRSMILVPIVAAVLSLGCAGRAPPPRPKPPIVEEARTKRAACASLEAPEVHGWQPVYLTSCLLPEPRADALSP